MAAEFYSQYSTMNGFSVLPVSEEELGRILQIISRMNL